MKFTITATLPLLAFALAATASLQAEDKIVIKGSDTLGAKMVPQLSEVYKETGSTASFEITAEGSSSAFTNLLAGTADIGISSRDIKDSEKESFAAKGLEVEEWVAGYDLIVVVVNGRNPVKDLSVEQVEGIFTGDIKDWSELGGDAGPISVYTRNTSSGTYKTFQEIALNDRDYGADTQKLAGNEQIAEEVSKNPNGIGYVGLAYASKDGIKSVSVDGVEPKAENAKAYAISRTLYYYTIKGKTSESAIKFVKWAKNDAKAVEVVERVGFIPAAE